MAVKRGNKNIAKVLFKGNDVSKTLFKEINTLPPSELSFDNTVYGYFSGPDTIGRYNLETASFESTIPGDQFYCYNPKLDYYYCKTGTDLVVYDGEGNVVNTLIISVADPESNGDQTHTPVCIDTVTGNVAIVNNTNDRGEIYNADLSTQIASGLALNVNTGLQGTTVGEVTPVNNSTGGFAFRNISTSGISITVFDPQGNEICFLRRDDVTNEGATVRSASTPAGSRSIFFYEENWYLAVRNTTDSISEVIEVDYEGNWSIITTFTDGNGQHTQSDAGNFIAENGNFYGIDQSNYGITKVQPGMSSTEELAYDWTPGPGYLGVGNLRYVNGDKILLDIFDSEWHLWDINSETVEIIPVDISGITTYSKGNAIQAYPNNLPYF